jgi:hypothetical protein
MVIKTRKVREIVTAKRSLSHDIILRGYPRWDLATGKRD